MALTSSVMADIGTPMPRFALMDVQKSERIDSDSLSRNKPTLVMFICNHCPFVVHVREELARLGNEYHNKGVAVIAISSNDVETHPDDSPEKMAAMAAELGFEFPYCFDETQEVARSFSAACTPDFFLYNKEGELAYRGQLDDSRPSNEIPVTGKDLRGALDTVLADQPPIAEQKASIGCNIKWKS